MDNKKIRVGYEIREEVEMKLRKVSGEYGISKNKVVERAIETELNRIEREYKPYK